MGLKCLEGVEEVFVIFRLMGVCVKGYVLDFRIPSDLLGIVEGWFFGIVGECWGMFGRGIFGEVYDFHLWGLGGFSKYEPRISDFRVFRYM